MLFSAWWQISAAGPVSSQRALHSHTLLDTRVCTGAHVCSSITSTISKPIRPDTEIHLSTNALLVPTQDAHPFSLGLCSTTHTHTHVDLVFTTPSTPSAADAFTKSFLVTTPSKFTIHRATRQWGCKPSTTARCTTMRRRLGQGTNTTGSPFGITNYRLLFTALPHFSPSLALRRNVRQLLRRRCRARYGR